MKVTLTQSRNQKILRGWILVRIETSNICTHIWTSAVFDPYREIYVWLGQIRDSQLPATMILDEEGRGVELFAEKVNDELIHFHIEPWLCGDDQQTCLSIVLTSQELISAFCNGITEFIEDDYQLPEWSYIDNLSNINWKALLQPSSFSSQNWRIRLAMYGGGHGRVPTTGHNSLEQPLSTEQHWLLVLYDALCKIVQLADQGQLYESYTLVSLYQNLLIDLALDEFDPIWYEKRGSEIEQETKCKSPKNPRNPERKRLQAQVRLSTLKVGQIVDGRVQQIKPYGVFVDIGGYYALLSISTISQVSIEHPDQIFRLGDWVRAMIIWMDVEKGRVLLSTSDLEPEPGDMLRDPLHVYEMAEEMAARYHQNVLSKLID